MVRQHCKKNSMLPDHSLMRQNRKSCLAPHTGCDSYVATDSCFTDSQRRFGGAGIPITVSALHREHLANSCDVGRSPHFLAKEFPQIHFSHLADPWWYEGARDERGIAVEPKDAFHKRVEDFDKWLRSHNASTVAVVGHGDFFHAFTGHRLQNCEVLNW
ncbi:histidine phosphatase family protein [Pantoea rodasii]|uniref:histidine phosphatase family protein n=1 Tax=Pantoea rodasii TaxID=1076549 RepID=UPI0012E04A0A|nr:histidine phosphatase family protein [Pantoea rodasii]